MVFTSVLNTVYWIMKSIEFAHLEKIRAFVINRRSGCRADRLRIKPHVSIDHPEKLKLGNNVTINQYSYLSCYGGLEIGNDVSMGHGTTIITTEHGYTDKSMPIKYQPLISKKVLVGNNVWIGANVTILAGVKLHDGTIVAAGAVVKKSTEMPNTIIGGVPSKLIKVY